MNLGVGYIPAYLPEHIEIDMKIMKQMGCNEVLFAISENNMYHLEGAIKFGAKIAKENGLTPYAVLWGYANTFGGGRISKFLLDHLDVLVEDENGNKTSVADMNHPMLVQKLIEFCRILIEYGYEGIFIDEPAPQISYSKYSKEVYYSLFGESLTYHNNEEKIKKYQRHTIKNYLEQVCKGIKAIDKNIKTLVSVMPHDQHFWKEIIQLDGIDIFGTTPYWLFEGHHLTMKEAFEIAMDLKALCQEYHKQSQIWLNCWGVRSGYEEEIYTGGNLLASVNCDHLYTWSFKGGLGTTETCDDPYKSWDNVVKLYGHIHTK
jgi:hypothetical protein